MLFFLLIRQRQYINNSFQWIFVSFVSRINHFFLSTPLATLVVFIIFCSGAALRAQTNHSVDAVERPQRRTPHPLYSCRWFASLLALSWHVFSGEKEISALFTEFNAAENVDRYSANKRPYRKTSKGWTMLNGRARNRTENRNTHVNKYKYTGGAPILRVNLPQGAVSKIFGFLYVNISQRNKLLFI